MEPIKAPVEKLKINYVVFTIVEDIRENAPPDGWWVHFQGSRESLFFNGNKPFEKGDTVKITFEKVDNAFPSTTSV